MNKNTRKIEQANATIQNRVNGKEERDEDGESVNA